MTESSTVCDLTYTLKRPPFGSYEVSLNKMALAKMSTANDDVFDLEGFELGPHSLNDLLKMMELLEVTKAKILEHMKKNQE